MSIVPPESDGVNPPQRYRKAAVPMASRRALARRYGCAPGEHITAACKCGATGTIAWFLLSSGRPGAWVHFSGLEIDHVIPERRGGTHAPDNLALLCRSCNRRKGTR